ncbi:MAG TPA: ABC transporter permease [Bryobacteraceae bacterium]|nr:ABC transporter permease [Bryobacteraceae bacterium]
METLVRNLRQALRRLRKAPGFASATVLTLALGIGANTAIFSVVNGVVLKPLPFPHPDELITVNHFAPGVNLRDAGTAPFLHFTYRDQAHSFQDLALFNWAENAVTQLGEPETALSLNASAQFLPILGVRPALGRWFSDKDDAPGAP